MKEIWCLVLFPLVFQSVATATFSEMKRNMENKVIKMAESYQQAYASRCSPEVIRCDTKSFYLCEGSADKKCIEDFPLKTDCIGYGSFLANHSGFRYPNHVDVQKMNNEMVQFVCTSANIQKVFYEVAEERNKVFTFSFIADIFGGIRIHPSSIDAAAYGCRDYDSRVRPWYNLATSVQKDVVIVVERSKQMGHGKLEQAVVAAKAIIASLSTKDYFSVVLFDAYTEVMLENKLKRASEKTTENYRYNLDYILPKTKGPNVEKAFSTAIKTLKKGSSCSKAEKIIFIIGSGKISYGRTDESLLAYIQTINTIDAKIFAFIEGSLGETSIFQQIACNNGGIAFQRQKSEMMESEVLTNIQGYFEFLVSKIPSDVKPVWTEPYNDAFGYGKLVTVSKPIFYQEDGKTKFIGVAAFDFKLSIFESKGLSVQYITQSLTKYQYCFQTDLPQCFMQILRPIQCSISEVCSDSYQIQECDSSFSKDFKKNPETVEPKHCCFLSISELMAIIFGFSVMVFIISLILWWRRKKRLKKERKQRRKLRKIRQIRLAQQEEQKQEQQQMSQVQVFDLEISQVKKINQKENNK